MKLNQRAFDSAIIDLHGTLVDTLGDFVVALNLMLADMSLPPVERDVVALRVGKGSEHSITRMAVATEAEAEKQHATTAPWAASTPCPTASMWPTALFPRSSPSKPGIGDDDLELVFQALAQMFEHDRSAARGEMSTRGLYVFKHDCELGNAPSHALFDKLKIAQMNPGEVARSFDAYQVAFDGKALQVGESVAPAPGVTLTRKC